MTIHDLAQLDCVKRHPHYLRGDVLLVNADCMDILPRLPDKCVDAVVTDPPFHVRTHDGARTFVATGRCVSKGFASGEGFTRLVHFSALDDEAFVAVMRSLIDKSCGWVVATCDWRHLSAAERAGLNLVRFGVWVKPDGAPQFTGDRPGTGWEPVGIFHRPSKKAWNGGGSHAVWTYGRDRTQAHPSVKPLPLIAKWIEQFSDPDALILDPFLGSGTTAVACVQLNRACFGIEIDPTYFAIACKRVDEAFDQTALIDPTPPATVSPGLFDEMEAS